MLTPSEQKEKILNFITNNDLFLFPLHSVVEGRCTCGNISCSSPGKHPLLKYNWKLSATNKEENIKKWLQKENVNYAIITGKESSKTGKKLIVIDVDSSEHNLIQELPKTFSYQTGSGGWHFWFWSKYSIGNSVSFLADKVDVRGKNGYVIIPPSIHKSGNRYNFNMLNSVDTPIADLPQGLLTSLLRKKETTVQKKKTRSKKIILTHELKSWSSLPVNEIKERVLTGEIIPLGVRNTTIHRLLSSDRANGAKGYTTIYSLALKYKKFCQEYETMDNQEIKSIVSSVLKYECRNNTHEKVNQAYFDFMEEKGRKVPKEVKELIVKSDIDFFSDLRKSKEKNQFIGLDQIQKSREEWMKSKGLKSYSKYPNSLLAAKLKELGFERIRTNQRNVWNVSLKEFTNFYLDGIVEQQTEPEQEEIRANMTMKIIEEQTIKVKRKVHPNAHLYPGRSSQETLSSLMKFMGVLEPWQLHEMKEGKLIVNQEETEKLFDSVLPGDIFGVTVFREGKGYVATQLKVERIENDTLFGKDISNPKKHFDMEATFEEVSVAQAMGFAEILMRDDLPYGVDLEVEFNVRLIEEEKEEETSKDTPSDVSAAPEKVEESKEV
jgi:hypothetical protein